MRIVLVLSQQSGYVMGMALIKDSALCLSPELEWIGVEDTVLVLRSVYSQVLLAEQEGKLYSAYPQVHLAAY